MGGSYKGELARYYNPTVLSVTRHTAQCLYHDEQPISYLVTSFIISI